jgi:adenosylmethionine---8-amino-7-oxononanoate aminotransferase
MSVSARDVFTQPFREQLFDVIHLPNPAVDAEGAIAALRVALQRSDIAAFIAEPCILGSGGMHIYSHEVLEQLFALCRAHHVPIIADEVMTGFGRTGSLFCCDGLVTKPDMMCLSKGLTGGFLPMGITLTAGYLHDAFVDTDVMRMLFHGHSFTANPLACAAANASLDLLLQPETMQHIQRIAARHRAFAERVAPFSPRTMGVVLALDVPAMDRGYTSGIRKQVYDFFLPQGILMRPLGNVLYLLPPYCITNEELDRVYEAILTFLQPYRV